MTLLDIFVALIVLMGLWRGFQAGAIRTAISFVAWLIALIVASKFAKPLAPLFAGLFDSSVLQISGAFLLVVLGVIMVAHLIIAMMTGVLKVLRLGFLDRLFGGVLGACQGVLKVLIVLSIASPLLLHFPSYQDSILTQSLLPFAPIAQELLKEVLGGAWQEIQNPYR